MAREMEICAEKLRGLNNASVKPLTPRKMIAVAKICILLTALKIA
jgi:hypothetical protein